jgi:glutamate/tyrosine decarboxylase-like PLP-dependent enzyme
MKDKEIDRNLAWFIGPKAENSTTFSELLNFITQDYFHWRKNYFPEDPLLISKCDQRTFDAENDKMYQHIHEFLAALRRNFPFYNPRYIAHMLSDISMPSMLGYFGAMLYNGNNVTPEAAPVTTEWEIEACNNILEMLGFKPSPTPPSKNASIKDWEQYQKELRSEFGWAHISSGGTIANIEALWVARSVKYFPLSVKEVAKRKNLSIEVKTANGNSVDIRNIDEFDLINIKPNESIYLFSKYIKSYIEKYPSNDISLISEKAMSELGKAKASLSNNLGELLSKYPLAIYVSGTAHYSINKAADILGIGRNNIKIIEIDSQFRADVKKLKYQIKDSLKNKISPLAVIGIAGTTEEGSIDPIHKIVDLRKEFEKESNISFWLHVDSAWGGYAKTILELNDEEKYNIIFQNVLKKSKEALSTLLSFDDLTNFIINQSSTYIKSKIKQSKDELDKALKNRDFVTALNKLNDIVLANGNSNPIISKEDINISLIDRVVDLCEYSEDKITISYKGYSMTKGIFVGDKEFVSSFIAFKFADSITVDPHKLGYIQYPCGVIAFKNDRIRHFITQKAPYITSSQHNALLHNPPLHVNNVDYEKLSNKNLPYDEYSVSIDAFAPFILEGSKPGAAAAALWLSNKCIPLSRQFHGSIIKNSLLATRELYEWMISWKKVLLGIGEDTLYEFLPISPQYPDLNVFVFAIKPNFLSSIKDMNKLTELVYQKYSIQAELGDKKHSYSQAYFLSKTTFSPPNYSFKALSDFFSKNNFRNAKDEYNECGLLVLRATLMNPYIYPYKKIKDLNLIKEFIIDLHKTSNELAKKLL